MLDATDAAVHVENVRLRLVELRLIVYGAVPPLLKICCLDCSQELVERYLEWSRRDSGNCLEGKGKRVEEEDGTLDFPLYIPSTAKTCQVVYVEVRIENRV